MSKDTDYLDAMTECIEANADVKEGVYVWHIHHDVLVGAAYEDNGLLGRVDVIATQKPLEERLVRLQRMRPVKAQRILKALIAARARLSFAGMYGNLSRDERDRVTEAMDATTDAVCDLHEMECPGCPWQRGRRASIIGTLFQKGGGIW